MGLIKVAAGVISIPIVHAVTKFAAEIFPGTRAAGMWVLVIWTAVALLFSISAAIATAICARRPPPDTP